MLAETTVTRGEVPEDERDLAEPSGMRWETRQQETKDTEFETSTSRQAETDRQTDRQKTYLSADSSTGLLGCSSLLGYASRLRRLGARGRDGGGGRGSLGLLGLRGTLDSGFRVDRLEDARLYVTTNIASTFSPKKRYISSHSIIPPASNE